jgi:hypothetical protein
MNESSFIFKELFLLAIQSGGEFGTNLFSAEMKVWLVINFFP